MSGKVYKITSNLWPEVYVGSTTLNLEQRLSLHVNKAINGASNSQLHRKIREYENAELTITLITEVAGDDLQIRQMEQQHIAQLKSQGFVLLNERKAIQTKAEWREYMRKFYTAKKVCAKCGKTFSQSYLYTHKTKCRAVEAVPIATPI